MRRPPRSLRALSASGYEIFDEDFGETGEVVKMKPSAKLRIASTMIASAAM